MECENLANLYARQTLAGVITSAFVITFSCIINAVSTEKKNINPLKKIRPQTLDGDLFSDRVWTGPLGRVIYLCLAGNSTKNHNMNPHPDRIGTSITIFHRYCKIQTKKNMNPDVFGTHTSLVPLESSPLSSSPSSSIPHSWVDELQLLYDISKKHYLTAERKPPQPLP